jgi:carbon-monoxide dehydrogenase large subunit
VTLLGRRMPRLEDHRFLTGTAAYVEDVQALELEGAAHVAFVRSTTASGRIVAVDTAAARARPGVVAVLGAADVDLLPEPPVDERVHQAMARPYLAGGVVR